VIRQQLDLFNCLYPASWPFSLFSRVRRFGILRAP